MVLLEEWDSFVVKEVLRFIYQGRAEMPEQDPLRFADRLWHAGLFFMAEGLSESALGYLMQHTSRETCAEVLVIAAAEGDIPELAQHCVRVLRSLHKVKSREEAEELLAAAELVGGKLGDEVAEMVFQACRKAVVVKNCMDLMVLSFSFFLSPCNAHGWHTEPGAGAPREPACKGAGGQVRRGGLPGHRACSGLGGGGAARGRTPCVSGGHGAGATAGHSCAGGGGRTVECSGAVDKVRTFCKRKTTGGALNTL